MQKFLIFLKLNVFLVSDVRNTSHLKALLPLLDKDLLLCFPLKRCADCSPSIASERLSNPAGHVCLFLGLLLCALTEASVFTSSLFATFLYQCPHSCSFRLSSKIQFLLNFQIFISDFLTPFLFHTTGRISLSLYPENQTGIIG